LKKAPDYSGAFFIFAIVNIFQVPVELSLNPDARHEAGSAHPTWVMATSVKWVLKPLLRIRRDYEVCKNNPDLIRFYFNGTTTLENIENIINSYQWDLDKIINENTFSL
jgi:hypothetical protein